MNDPKRVLILTADAGFGHRSAANALAEALQVSFGEGCVVEIANPLDDPRTPAILRDSQSDYDRLVREMPEIYRLRYQISDAAFPNAVMESAVTVMLFKIIQDHLNRYRPDVIVTTHPLYPAPLSAAIAVSKGNPAFFTVVTDLGTVHRMWFNPAVEMVCVPTAMVREQAIEAGIPAGRVRVTGIPVRTDLARDKWDQAELRTGLGWRTDLTTVLMVGSKRVKNLDGVLHLLNHSALPMQLVVVAGGDDELYARLQETEWHGVTHVYNYVEDMPTFLLAADCIISKAGGLIVTEAMAAGLPMLLVDVTPGQEEGNADYVVKNGAAARAEDPVQALETLFHWLDKEGAELKERAARARELGRPLAAYAVADLIWEVAERGPLPVPESRLTLLPKIMELLNQFGIVGEGQGAEDKPSLI